jgi:hypothetical protein
MLGGLSPRTGEFIGVRRDDESNRDRCPWLAPDEARLERCRALIQSIKGDLMAHSSTEMEKIAIILHFPVDDHEENT